MNVVLVCAVYPKEKLLKYVLSYLQIIYEYLFAGIGNTFFLKSCQ